MFPLLQFISYHGFFFMHDIVIHLPNSPNKDAEDLDNGENPGNNNGILIQPVFLYVKNQLH